MNSKFDTYLLHSLHSQFFGFYSLIPFLRASAFANCFSAKAQSAIFPTKYILGFDLISLLLLHSGRWSPMTNAKLNIRMENLLVGKTCFILVWLVCFK